MIDIRTTPIGRAFDYTDLIGATQAVWGGASWPSAEMKGSVIVLGAGHDCYDDGNEISVLDQYESFNVREMVGAIEAFDLKYWLSWPRIDHTGDPCGRWIADETHEAAKEFMRLARDRSNPPPAKTKYGRPAGQPRRLQLRFSRAMEIEPLYDFLLPTIHNWLQPEHQLLYLKESNAAFALSQYDALDDMEMSKLKLGHSPAIEALGFAAVELQAYLKRREQSKYLGTSEDDGKRSLHEV